MSTKKLKIGAYVMVHNMAELIPACLNSLAWVDAVFVYDDHSTDASLENAQKYSKCRLIYERSTSEINSFQSGELEVRNMLIDRAFDKLDVDLLIIIDADEMLSEKIEPLVQKVFANKEIDSMCFSIWHLYDNTRYLHFWETKINGVGLIDPHTRIIRRGKYFTPLFKDGSHPILEAGVNTFCVHGPYHFHLKYFHLTKLPNYSLFFLPERIEEKDALPYLKDLPFVLPSDIKDSLAMVNWDLMPYYEETPHYSSKRIQFNDPKEALIHPKDKKDD